MVKRVRYPARVVKNYIKKINLKIDVEGVLLFGSFAYGEPHKWSDVDLAVISPDFKKKDFDERIDWLIKEREGVATSIAMDIVGYTPREFMGIENESAVMAYAKKHGKWIFRKKEKTRLVYFPALTLHK